MKKKAILIGTIFVALLMLITPMVSSMKTTVIDTTPMSNQEQLKNKNSNDCVLCESLKKSEIKISGNEENLFEELKNYFGNEDCDLCQYSSNPLMCSFLFALSCFAYLGVITFFWFPPISLIFVFIAGILENIGQIYDCEWAETITPN